MYELFVLYCMEKCETEGDIREIKLTKGKVHFSIFECQIKRSIFFSITIPKLVTAWNVSDSLSHIFRIPRLRKLYKSWLPMCTICIAVICCLHNYIRTYKYKIAGIPVHVKTIFVWHSLISFNLKKKGWEKQTTLYYYT